MHRWILLACVVAGVIAFTWVGTDGGGRTLAVEREALSIVTVSRGPFEEYVPVRGVITPIRTVYLDAIEGGRVERIITEQGATVATGDPIVELSNTSLQLNVITREAEVNEQINNLRNTHLALEQNRLRHKRELVEINYQIKRLRRELERQEQLITQQAISQQDVDATRDTYDYYVALKEVTEESQAQDEAMRVAQIAQLEAGIGVLERNLAVSRQNLDNLLIRAPTDGQLTSLNAELGESMQPGERIGQVDRTDGFKVEARVDEFYISRVYPGQVARLEIAGESYELSVIKVYPEVINNQFQLDLTFTDTPPHTIRRGQGVSLNLNLDEPREALLLSTGAFMNDSGGNYVFVVEGDRAERRSIQVGRRNLRYLELLDGLENGEQVIVSSYQTYTGIEQLELN